MILALGFHLICAFEPSLPPDRDAVRSELFSAIKSAVTFRSEYDIMAYLNRLPGRRLRAIDLEVLLELYETPERLQKVPAKLRDFHRALRLRKHISIYPAPEGFDEFERMRHFGLYLLRAELIRVDLETDLHRRILSVVTDWEIAQSRFDALPRSWSWGTVLDFMKSAEGIDVRDAQKTQACARRLRQL